MKELYSNGFASSIAQAIEEMKAEQGDSFSLDQINLAELERRSGVSRGKLRRLKKNGFQELPRSSKGRKRGTTKLFDHKNLISYELEEIAERALALTKIVVLVKWESNGIVHTEHFEFGCSYQQEDGTVGYPWKNNGAWILIPWKIQGLYK